MSYSVKCEDLISHLTLNYVLKKSHQSLIQTMVAKHTKAHAWERSQVEGSRGAQCIVVVMQKIAKCSCVLLKHTHLAVTGMMSCNPWNKPC